MRRQAFPLFLAALAAVSVASLMLAAGAAADPTLQSKEAQAEAVLAQIRQLDSETAQAVEAFNLANIKLGEIQKEQARNGVRLKVARKSLGKAQLLLEQRLVAIYTSGTSGTAMDVILGATSIEDLLNRLETVDRVSDQDAEVLRQVASFRETVKNREAQLEKAHGAQERVVAERAAHRRFVEGKLRERQALLTTIKDEIRKIQERERARQLALARQARARVTRSSPDPAPAAEAQAALLSADVPEARYGGVVGIAMRYLGVPYRWGGSSPSSGFDCSGFTMYVYAQVGVSLPHNAAMQYGLGTPVSKSQLAPGDLVFFNGLGHMGMYIGGGQFIHAPHTGDVVKISSLSDSWYARTYIGARRL
ncbi:MAG: C40 family peptidase [Thermoleophilia bacterium]|nr:C40 family peptidase [Thermoleophilia bacterium]